MAKPFTPLIVQTIGFQHWTRSKDMEHPKLLMKLKRCT